MNEDRSAVSAAPTRRWVGPASSVLAVAVWMGLAWVNPTTTYHFAPLVAAGAWPVVDRLRRGPAPFRARAAAAAGGTAITLVAFVVLAIAGALRGPALLGVPVSVEAVIGAISGGVIGVLVAVPLPERTGVEGVRPARRERS